MQPCFGIRMPGLGVAGIEVIVWLRFMGLVFSLRHPCQWFSLGGESPCKALAGE